MATEFARSQSIVLSNHRRQHRYHYNTVVVVNTLLYICVDILRIVLTDQMSLSFVCLRYLVLHFLPRDALNAKRGIAIISRPSVRPSCVYNVDVPWSYRLGYFKSN